MAAPGAARVGRVMGVTGGEPPTRWVHLQQIQWTDERGRDRTWEAAVRAGARPVGSGVADAVAVFARMRYGAGGAADGALGTALVAQFRPPVGRVTLELPAGLIDAGETPAAAAVRELKEETGYVGEVARVSPVVFSSPGLTNESMQLVEVDVDMTRAENAAPVSEQEDSECIENITVRYWPRPAAGRPDGPSLLQAIEAIRAERGFEVDARLWSLAAGMEMAGGGGG